MKFDILTIFPAMFASPFGESIIRRAVEAGVVEVRIHDLRAWATDKHKVTDDYPYGGGPGMVMKVEPLARAITSLREKNPGAPVILLTPQGRVFKQSIAQQLAGQPGLILVCGRYEGVDERVRRHYCDMEISLGDFVLTGGEIPAMALVDAVLRLIPGALGGEDSTWEESHTAGLLEYPQYTRPAEFEGQAAPEILLSGHRANIEAWRRRESIIRTSERRPDLIEKAGLKGEEMELAMEIIRKAREKNGR
ncbi:MAG: tRNA (guanosine(37)-N1)-methyltransferase TrmD [Nitrospinota bacterium]|nr:tRNA (guanosine(37)-N1)-methyltransferase TrmD [Nitrospinota bacterium]